MDVGLAAIAVITLSVAAGSLLKGVTGVGGPMVAIPVMATFLGVEHAVVVMAIPGLVMNGWLVWRYRAARDQTRDLPVLAATGAIGVTAGVWALVSLDERLLSACLAAAIMAYLVVRVTNASFEIPPDVSRALSPLAGLGSGLMHGSTGISGPMVATYVHGANLPRAGYVLSVSALFAVFSTAQVAVIASVGLYSPTRLVESALACIPALALLPVGDWIGRRLTARSFNGVVLVSLGAIAANLFYHVITGR